MLTAKHRKVKKGTGFNLDLLLGGKTKCDEFKTYKNIRVINIYLIYKSAHDDCKQLFWPSMVIFV